MAELGETGSLMPGRGTPAIFESAAQRNELTVTPDVRAAWGALTHLVAHVDNRVDADYPNSHPVHSLAGPEIHDPEVWLPYAWYLASAPTEEVALPDPDFLMPRQQEAFTDMRAAMNALEGISREAFASNFMDWLRVAHVARTRRFAIGLPSSPQYLACRRREGAFLAAMFEDLVPPANRGQHFESYAHFMRSMGVAAKLGDSAIDLPKDLRNGNANVIAPKRTRALAALVAAAEVSFVIATRPGLLKPIAEKALLFVRNRSGKHNAERTH